MMLQIEFYFSDSNLPRDVFMADQIAADPEVSSSQPSVCQSLLHAPSSTPDSPVHVHQSEYIYTSQGFVDISLLCTFKRMRDLLGIKEADTTKEKMPQSLLSAVSVMAARCSVATKQLPPDASALTSIMQLMSRLCTSRYCLTSLTCRS